jgi:hypothetical protein
VLSEFKEKYTARLAEDANSVCVEALFDGLIVICIVVFFFAIFLGAASRTSKAWCAVVGPNYGVAVVKSAFTSLKIYAGGANLVKVLGIAGVGAFACFGLPVLATGGVLVTTFPSLAAIPTASALTAKIWLGAKGIAAAVSATPLAAVLSSLKFIPNIMASKSFIATIVAFFAPIINAFTCQFFNSVGALFGLILLFVGPYTLHNSKSFKKQVKGHNPSKRAGKVLFMVFFWCGTITTYGSGLVGANRRVWLVMWTIFSAAHCALAFIMPTMVGNMSKSMGTLEPQEIIDNYYISKGKLSVWLWVSLTLILPCAVAAVPFMYEDYNGTTSALAQKMKALMHPTFI